MTVHNFFFLIFTLILSLGSQAIVDRLFPNMEVQPSEGYNFSLQFNCDQLSNPDKFLSDVSEIKRHLFGGPLERAFNALQALNNKHNLFFLKKTSHDLMV